MIFKHRSIANDEYRIVKGPEDGIQAVRENVTQGADVIKVYSNNTPNNTYLSIAEMQAIVGEAHRYHIRVTAHATDDRVVYNAVMAINASRQLNWSDRIGVLKAGYLADIIAVDRVWIVISMPSCRCISS